MKYRTASRDKKATAKLLLTPAAEEAAFASFTPYSFVAAASREDLRIRLRRAAAAAAHIRAAAASSFRHTPPCFRQLLRDS